MKAFLDYLKSEILLVVSALAALVSACFMSAQEFFKLTLPLSAVSFLVLTLGTLIVKPHAVELRFAYRARIGSKMQLVLFAGLFCLCIASVLGGLHYLVTTTAVVLSVFAQEKAALLIGTNLGALGILLFLRSDILIPPGKR